MRFEPAISILDPEKHSSRHTLTLRYEQLGALRQLTACTSGNRRTSATNRASNGELLSLLQTRDIGNGKFRSTTGRMSTPLGHLQRAVPLTKPTPIPWDTRLRIVASFSAS